MKVEIIDAADLAGEGKFTQFNLKKYGWEQYPTISAEDIGKVIWRCNVIVSPPMP